VDFSLWIERDQGIEATPEKFGRISIFAYLCATK